jgi:hypothetical protein
MNFVLVPSPLLRAESWAAVGAELSARGHGVLLPELTDSDDSGEPYWRQHAMAVKAQVREVFAPFVLVGHSGAGPLLPLIAEALGDGVACYLFVDAGLPAAGSRFETFAIELGPKAAASFRADLESGGVFPTWDDDLLASILDDPVTRRSILEMVRPRALPFWEESLPLPANWPDARCAYLRLSAAYDRSAEESRKRGWPTRALDGSHFEIMTRSRVVADEILVLLRRLGLS